MFVFLFNKCFYFFTVIKSIIIYEPKSVVVSKMCLFYVEEQAILNSHTYLRSTSINLSEYSRNNFAVINFTNYLGTMKSLIIYIED